MDARMDFPENLDFELTPGNIMTLTLEDGDKK